MKTGAALNAGAAPPAVEDIGRLFMEAVALERSGCAAEAEPVLNHLLALDPAHPDVLHMLAGLMMRDGRHEAALDMAERAIAARPQTAMFHRTHAVVLRALGRHDQGMAASERALRLDPGDHHSLLTRSSFHVDRLAFDLALADATRARAIHPAFAEAHLRLGELHLLQGDFPPGWEGYEWNGRISGVPPVLPADRQSPANRQWDGSFLENGRLLLIADQGFGDAIQFARYIPWARARCRHMALACDPALTNLMARCAAGVEIFDRWPHVPDFVAWSALSSLPRLHGTELATIPPQSPPIVPDPVAAAGWRARLDAVCPAGARRIGLVWGGRPTHPNDAKRSMPLGTLSPVAALPGLFLVSLQQGPRRADISGFSGAAPLLDLGRVLSDLADTAAVIAGLDLVITVDTSVAHLAGAMGKPVWIMLPYAPDWRWLLRRDDSPWYPSARLFRQPVPDRWDEVVEAIAAALR